MPDTDGLVSDSEILGYVSDSYGELMDLIASKNEDAVTRVYQVVTTANTIYPYEVTGEAVPVAPNRPVGWARIRSVFRVNGSGLTRLENVSVTEWPRFNGRSGHPDSYTVMGDKIYVLPTPTDTETYYVAYIPSYAADLLTSDVIEVVPIVFRWEEYVVVSAAIKCLRKEESDTSELMQEKAELQARISQSLTSRGGPSRVSEVRKYRSSSLDWDWEY